MVNGDGRIPRRFIRFSENEYLIHLEKSLIKERMKLHLKYIVALVITALVCIFAYQTYWLVGLYQSQEKEVEAKIKGGMEYAHFMEMKKRIERLRNDDKGPHRQLTGSVAFSMDEDDDIDQKVKVKKVRGGKIVQSVQTTFTKQEKRSEDDKDQELMMMM